MRQAAGLLLAAAALLATAASTAAEIGEGPSWSGEASLYGFFVPDEPDFPMVVAGADTNDAWHFEGHYNYESRRTGAVFVGRSFGRGQGLAVRATPMVGGVFGELDGFAPALRVTTALHRFDLSIEAEYVVDVATPPSSFFYNWSELGYRVFDWLRVGLVEQRMRLHQGELQLDAGVLIGVSIKRISVTFYEFNAGWDDPTFVTSLSAGF